MREEPPSAQDPTPRAGLKQLLADKAKERRDTAAESVESKKRKEQQQGTKMAAETSVEEAADESKADGEVIDGLPTPQNLEPSAAYSDDGLLDEQGILDERTGEALPLESGKPEDLNLTRSWSIASRRTSVGLKPNCKA